MPSAAVSYTAVNTSLKVTHIHCHRLQLHLCPQYRYFRLKVAKRAFPASSYCSGLCKKETPKTSEVLGRWLHMWDSAFILKNPQLEAFIIGHAVSTIKSMSTQRSTAIFLLFTKRKMRPHNALINLTLKDKCEGPYLWIYDKAVMLPLLLCYWADANHENTVPGGSMMLTYFTSTK